MNENKWIDSPQLTTIECVKDEKTCWIMITKTMVVISEKIPFTDFVLTDKRSLLGKRPKWASAKSSSFRFSLSAARNANTKATEYETLGFCFCILVFFPFWESLNLTVCQWYGYFNVLAATIRERSDKLPCIENREGFAVHLSTLRSGAKGESRVSSWLAISTHVQKIRYFFTCVVTSLLRAGIPCITLQFTWFIKYVYIDIYI